MQTPMHRGTPVPGFAPPDHMALLERGDSPLSNGAKFNRIQYDLRETFEWLIN